MVRLPPLPAPILRALLDCAIDDDASDPAVMAARYFDDPMPLDRVWLAYEPVLVAAWAEEYAGSRPPYW